MLLINIYKIKKYKNICENARKTRIHVYTREGRQVSNNETEDGMTEKRIEQRLVSEVKKRGGIAAKWVSPGFDGVPDRILLFQGGVLAFVELKAPGEKMRPLQVRRKKQLEALGFQVYCIDNINMIGGMLDEIQTA